MGGVEGGKSGGREEGRKGGREEGRKGGREERRKGPCYTGGREEPKPYLTERRALKMKASKEKAALGYGINADGRTSNQSHK